MAPRARLVLTRSHPSPSCPPPAPPFAPHTPGFGPLGSWALLWQPLVKVRDLLLQLREWLWEAPVGQREDALPGDEEAVGPADTPGVDNGDCLAGVDRGRQPPCLSANHSSWGWQQAKVAFCKVHGDPTSTHCSHLSTQAWVFLQRYSSCVSPDVRVTIDGKLGTSTTAGAAIVGRSVHFAQVICSVELTVQ